MRRCNVFAGQGPFRRPRVPFGGTTDRGVLRPLATAQTFLSVIRPKGCRPVSVATQDRILRIRAVLKRTGLTRSTLYRKIHAGTFPKQVRISVRCAGWHESAVNAWLKNPMFYSVDDEPDADAPPPAKPRRRVRSPEPSCSNDEPMLPLGFDACRRSPSDDRPLPLR